MPKPVIFTYKILKDKALNENIDESRVKWALEMMEAGFESENLYMLAGELRPYNQSELQDLTDKVLKDLQLDYSDKDAVMRNYAYYIIAKSVNHPGSYLKTLGELSDIHLDRDYAREYADFQLLCYAKDDLRQSENQWYWDGATRENIDEIIKNKFEEWITQYLKG